MFLSIPRKCEWIFRLEASPWPSLVEVHFLEVVPGLALVDSEETIIEARFRNLFYAPGICVRILTREPEKLLALTALLINANFIAISTSSSHLGGARDVKRAMMM